LKRRWRWLRSWNEEVLVSASKLIT
jgi:hypothetical protein